MSETVFQTLRSTALRALAKAASSGHLDLDDATFTVQKHFPSLGKASQAEAIAGLRWLGTVARDAKSAAAMLTLLADARESLERAREDIALVWTGPDSLGAENRDTAPVMEAMFAGATKSVLLAGYNFQPGAHFDALRAALAAHPTLRVEVFAHVFRKPGHTEAESIAAHRKMLHKAFGDEVMPRLDVWQPAHALASKASFSLHAKVVVVDRRQVLVTSANFSFSAQETNIELGLQLDDHALANRIHAQFLGLCKHHHMVRFT